jgi:hypothetical protein
MLLVYECLTDQICCVKYWCSFLGQLPYYAVPTRSWIHRRRRKRTSVICSKVKLSMPLVDYIGRRG